MIINRTPEFKRNYKKLKRKHYNMNKLKHVIGLIVAGNKQELTNKHKDHKLKGKYRGFRELHVDRQYNDDWVLVYRIKDDKIELYVLDLISTGNHDHIFR